MTFTLDETAIGDSVSAPQFEFNRSRSESEPAQEDRLVAHSAKRLIMVGGRILKLGAHSFMYVKGGREGIPRAA